MKGRRKMDCKEASSVLDLFHIEAEKVEDLDVCEMLLAACRVVRTEVAEELCPDYRSWSPEGFCDIMLWALESSSSQVRLLIGSLRSDKLWLARRFVLRWILEHSSELLAATS